MLELFLVGQGIGGYPSQSAAVASVNVQVQQNDADSEYVPTSGEDLSSDSSS